MSDNKVVSASLCIEVWVECPHCDNAIDLRNSNDTDGYEHDDCGGVMKQACPDGYWSDEHEKFSIENVTCSKCKKDFDVKKLEW